MKTVTVTSNNQQYEVKLNNLPDDADLTPAVAQRARNIAFGLGAYVTVTDGTSTYRVTRSVRKIK